MSHSRNDSQTEAGLNKPENNQQLVDAIIQVFALFSLNYHNQFHAAYTDFESENTAKKLWLNSLTPFSAETILHAANQLIQSSEYLPTLSKFISACDSVQFTLPSVREAYLEACNADPTHNRNWSHPVVYHTGKASGWHLLRSEPESKSWPIFRENYVKQCEKVRNGERLALPPATGEKPRPVEALEPEEQKKRLAELKASLSLNL